MKNTTKRNRPIRVPKPSPTPSRKHRNLNTLIVIVLAIILFSVTVGVLLSNAGKEYRLSNKQREANEKVQYIQNILNNIPDDPEWLSDRYEESLFYKNAPEADLFVETPPTNTVSGKITPVDEEYQKQVDEIGKDVLQFIKGAYDSTKNWNFRSVPAYFYSDSSRELFARYFPTEEILCFNENGMYPVRDLKHVTVFSMTAHEQVHALMDYNLGDPFCTLDAEDGKSVGFFLHEAVVEKITYDYLKSKGIYPLQVHAGEALSSSYELLLYNLEAFEMIFECNIVECMLNQENHDLPSNLLESATGDKLAYARWLYWMDRIMYGMWSNDSGYTLSSQGYLNQFYCWYMDDNSEKVREFSDLTNYYLLRCMFLKTHLKTKAQCVGAWFILTEFNENPN